MDLAGIARQVIDAIDLAEIIRESAGVVSSQAARAVRTEGMHADDSVATSSTGSCVATIRVRQ